MVTAGARGPSGTGGAVWGKGLVLGGFMETAVSGSLGLEKGQ